MFLHAIKRKYRIIKLGTILFLTLIANIGYAVDLWVGFPYGGDVFIEKLLSNGPIVPVQANGVTAQSAWAPSMTKFNGQFFMAFRESDGEIRIGWSQDGRHWTGFMPIHNLKARSTPRLQVFNNRMYLFYVKYKNTINSYDPDHHRMYYMSTADGINWSSTRRVPAGRSGKAVSTAVFKGRMYIAYRGLNAGQKRAYYNSTADGINWNGETWLSTLKTSEDPSLAVHKNQLFLAFKGGSTNNIYLQKTSNGVNWSPSWIPNSSWQTTKGPAIASYNNRLYLAHRNASSNQVMYSSSANGDNSWSALLGKSNSASVGMLTLAVY